VKPTFTPKNEHYAEVVRTSFNAQALMAHIGAQLSRLEPGLVEITMPFYSDLTQQNGFLHAGIVTTLADTACGFAALSLMPEGANVLSVEFKQNLLAPAVGETFVARGQVLRAGRTLSVCQGEVRALQQDEPKLIATMLATMIAR